MKFKNVDFNAKWADTKTEAEFVKEFHDVHEGLTDEDLKAAHADCKKEVAEAKKAEAKKK